MSTLLLVDDNPILIETFAYNLATYHGFTVFTAKDGIQGLEQFEAHHPDCVVIDVKMPELDGYQLVRALRGDPASATTPLIILTAMVQDADRLIGTLSGVDRYVAKPVSPEELAQHIQEVLMTNQAERQVRMQRLAEEN